MKPGIACGTRRRGWSPEELADELGRVHAREFARLLCRAARLRTLAPGTDCARWRSAAAHARRLAEIDGYELPGQLRHALARPLAEWVPAASLVKFALEIDSSAETRREAAALGCRLREERRWSS